MRKLPKQSYRIDVASEIADKLNPEFRIALLERFDNLIWWAMLHHNRNTVINGINSISKIGLYNYPSDNSRVDAINEAIEKLDLWSEASRARHIILFSNGDVISELSSTIKLASEKNIRISEIAMTYKESGITKAAFESTQGRFSSTFDEESLELAITKKDTDGDTLSDGDEVGISSEMFYDSVNKEYYYIVNSNPLLKDSDNDDLLDDIDNEPMKFNPKDSRVGLGFSSNSSNIVLTSKGPINATKEGESFKNAKFFSNHSFKEFYNNIEDRSFLIEFDENSKPLNYWLEVARVGSDVRGGNGNTMFAKCKENPSDTDDFMFPSILHSMQKFAIMELAGMWNDSATRENYLQKYPNLLQDNFLFYDKIKNKFYPATDEEYGDTYLNKNFRYELNDDYDKYLPKFYHLAKTDHGFTKAPKSGSKYHDPDNNFKYTHKDGREGVYSIVSHKPLVLLENEYTKQYGPTFNYIDSNLDLNLISNFFGHFYFDMLTYYWWDAV